MRECPPGALASGRQVRVSSNGQLLVLEQNRFTNFLCIKTKTDRAYSILVLDRPDFQISDWDRQLVQDLAKAAVLN